MPLPISRSALDALGKRLRTSQVSPEDWAILEQVLEAYQAALDEVQGTLTSVGLVSTSRVKSTGTLVEKLLRGSSFKSIQDVAGARIVTGGGLEQQDRVVDAIQRVFGQSSCRTVDRRQSPNHGYRAVHVIVTCQELPVEIQVRTELQDIWAQTMERLADRWGRGLRYGDPLVGADLEVAPHFTRGTVLDLVMDLGPAFARFEEQGEASGTDPVALSKLVALAIRVLEQIDDATG